MKKVFVDCTVCHGFGFEAEGNFCHFCGGHGGHVFQWYPVLVQFPDGDVIYDEVYATSAYTAERIGYKNWETAEKVTVIPKMGTR